MIGSTATLKRLVTALMSQGDALGEGVSCLPGTQPAPWRAGMLWAVWQDQAEWLDVAGRVGTAWEVVRS